DIIYYFVKCLGLSDDVFFRFSLWDPKNSEKYVGDAARWEKTQGVMRQILNHLGIKYTEAVGEAAFYGPKLDVQASNVHGKEDTLFTVQIDFSLAERFDMSYIDENGDKVRPLIIHRSSIGCYERTLAMLIEKYAGALPLWMAPVQVKVMSLTDRNISEAAKASAELRRNGIRVEDDFRNEKIGYKVRQAQIEKTPYMLVIGDKDTEQGVVTIRDRAGTQKQYELSEFIDKVKYETDNKVI
ncbi:MAG TPA: His/Gly/Thr/Pro-type tRNA ligase C-terminal domain-containing protein, partial [Eubacteriales bacterium]|nr:His/Gly/Thr/Pro-type tRNA ligase C-terminal domain-containing protein [Eubacteriales bacterium]